MNHRVVNDYSPSDGNESTNIKVFVRLRPLEDQSEPGEFLKRSDDGKNSSNDLKRSESGSNLESKLTLKDPEGALKKKYGETAFQFDTVFWTDVTQEEVFNSMCKPQIEHIMNGYNSCCFAYGQTGSGKTYSMFGEGDEVRGIIPRSVEYLFERLANKSDTHEVAIVCSFLEIYNDSIRDLGKAFLVAMGVESSTSNTLYEKTSDIFESLAGKRGNPYFAPAFHKAGATPEESAARPGLKEVQDEYNTMNNEIREDAEGNVFVKDLSLVPVSTLDEVKSMIAIGLKIRATHETKMNAFSSRSHTVFSVTVIQRDRSTGKFNYIYIYIYLNHFNYFLFS
jgi:hypothetical protein